MLNNKHSDRNRRNLQINPNRMGWRVINMLFFVVTIVFILFYISLRSYWPDLNGSLKVETGLAWNWTGILFIAVLTIWVYSSILIYRLFILKQNQFWLNKILALLFTLIFSFWLIILYLSDQSELILFITTIDFYSPIIYSILVIGLALLLPRFIKLFRDLWKNTHVKRSRIIALTLSLLYITGWFVPLIFIPTTVQDFLPPKPIILAHRGLTSLAPENTLVAGELASEMGADGWEVDIRMSADGKLFLMHDKNFIRTTNIANVFPDRKNDDVSTFNLAEIRQIDAGSWFIDDDPYQIFGFGKLEPLDYDKYRGLKIPTLKEVINLTEELDLILDLDLKSPPSDHPLFDNYDSSLFSQLLSSGLNPERVLLRSNNEKAINMTRLIRHIDEEAIQKNIVLDITAYLSNEQYNDLHNNNVIIMAGVVNSPERFSQLWCLGMEYVLTDTPHLFTKMSEPGFYFTRNQYLTYWGIICLISLSISVIFLKIFKKCSKIITK